MNYGVNSTLLEMDTKNRISDSVARAGRERPTSNLTVDAGSAFQSAVSRLASGPATEIAASIVAGVIVVGTIASAAVVA